MRSSYGIGLVASLQQDWSRKVRSRVWLQELAEELDSWNQKNAFKTPVDVSNVVKFVSGVADGEVRCSERPDLFDGLSFLASENSLALDISVGLHTLDSVGWAFQSTTSSNVEDVLSSLTEFFVVELSKSWKQAKWCSANVRRNAKRRCLLNTGLNVTEIC